MVRFNKYRKSYTIDSVQNSTCCPHCGIEYYSAKALTTHVSNRCTSNPLLQSNSYTRSYITKQINEGVINPHTSDFQNHALYNKPSLSVQASLNKASDSIDDIADVDYCSNDVDYGCDQTNYTTENEMTEMEENRASVNENQSDDDSDFTLQHDDEPEPDDDWMDYVVNSSLPSQYIENMLKSDYMANSKPESDENDYVRKPYDNTMKVNVTCWTHLLIIVNHHGGSAKLYNAIVKFITHWIAEYPNVFDTSVGKHQVWSRSRLVKELAKQFQTDHLKPQDRTCILPSNGARVTVPVVDFEAWARNLLDSDYVMSNIAPGIDPTTFRPIVDEETHESNPHAIIGEKHDGWAYRMGIKNNTSPNCDPIYERPFPLLCHDDYTHACTNQYLKLNPLQFFPAMLSNKAQSDFRNWRVGAFLPNLAASKTKEGKTSKTGIENIKDYHAVLQVALSSLRECCERGGFYWTDRQGRKVLMKPYLHCRLGDSAGHSENVGKIQASSTRCIMRECRCKFQDLTHFPPRCQPLQYSDYIERDHDAASIFWIAEQYNLISLKDTSLCFTNKAYAKHMSYYHGVKIAWNELPNSDPYFGVIGISALDFLHLFKGGTMRYKIISDRDVIGPNDTNSRVKGLVNGAFSGIRASLMRNAERDIYPMSNRHGYFSTTGLSCNEVIGNNFGYFVFLNTTYGRRLVKPCLDEIGVDYEEYLETTKLLFSWERFFLDTNKRSDIKDSAYATLRLMKRIMAHIPRKVKHAVGKTPGSNGWHILKFHGMWFIPFLVQKFGSVRGFDTDNNEKNHKVAVKGHIRYCNRQQSKFASQVAKNEHIRLTLEIALDAIERYIPESVRHLGKKLNVRSNTEHRYVRYMEDEQSDSDDSDDDSNVGIDYNIVNSVLLSSENDYGTGE
jgi:hypothetical protein